MKKLRVRAGMFATILSFLSLVFCAPPDRPYDTKYSKSPLAEPINTRAGYSYYLIGRLMQARYIVETAYGKGEPKFVQAKDQATNQKKELTAGENKVSHSCQQERILESRREGRENYSFKFDGCKTSDGRVEALLSGIEEYSTRFVSVNEGKEVQGVASESSDEFLRPVLDSLIYRTKGMRVELRPLKEVRGVLPKNAEISEETELVANLQSSEFIFDEKKIPHSLEVYHFYFRTVPESKVFQNLRLGELSAFENLTESFSIFGRFTVRDGQVISFSDGELRFESKGTRRVRSLDGKTNFSKFGQISLDLASYSNKQLEMPEDCSLPVGRLKLTGFKGLKETDTPQENRKLARTLVLEDNILTDLRSGLKLSGGVCLIPSLGKGIPYGHIYLR